MVSLNNYPHCYDTSICYDDMFVTMATVTSNLYPFVAWSSRAHWKSRFEQRETINNFDSVLLDLNIRQKGVYQPWALQLAVVIVFRLQPRPRKRWYPEKSGRGKGVRCCQDCASYRLYSEGGQSQLAILLRTALSGFIGVPKRPGHRPQEVLLELQEKRRLNRTRRRTIEKSLRTLFFDLMLVSLSEWSFVNGFQPIFVVL